MQISSYIIVAFGWGLDHDEWLELEKSVQYMKRNKSIWHPLHRTHTHRQTGATSFRLPVCR